MKSMKILPSIKAKSIAIKIGLKSGGVLHHFMNLR